MYDGYTVYVFLTLFSDILRFLIFFLQTVTTGMAADTKSSIQKLITNYMGNPNAIILCIQGKQLESFLVSTGSLYLKPEDSFLRIQPIFLDLQKMQEIIRKRHQTFLQLF